MNQFEQLAADMNTLAKGQGTAIGDQDTAAVAAAAAASEAAAAAAAAAGAGDAGAAGAGEGEGEGEGNGEGEGQDELLGKSQTAVIDGQEMQVVDATEMLKALNTTVGGLVQSNAALVADKEHLGKALGLMADLIKSQAQSIATLKTQVATIGGQGRGRKAVVSVADGSGAGAAGGSAGALTDLAKAGVEGADVLINGKHHPGGVTPEVFMEKALAAQLDGRIVGRDVAMAEAHLNRGIAVDPAVVRKVLQ